MINITFQCCLGSTFSLTEFHLLQHDDRDDGVDYWAKRGRGRGIFQRGRGRFNFKKSGSSPKWTHDKYQGDGLVEDEEETMENEDKERRKEEKVCTVLYQLGFGFCIVS